MKRKTMVWLAVLISIVSFAFGLSLGYIYPREPKVSFYAVVLKNSKNVLLVEGIPENDINHRSQFLISQTNEHKISVIDKYEKPINFSEITNGSLVRVVYDGWKLLTFPEQIEGAVLIQIVED